MKRTAAIVSVVIPVHNRPGMLREAVASVQEQDGVELQIIIVDDGSNDETPEAIGELCEDDSRIVAISRPQGGPGAARETGRRVAVGEYIQYLDSDDLLLHDKLTLQVEALRMNPGADLCLSLTRYRDASGAIVPCTWKPPIIPYEPLFPTILEGRGWETAAPLYRRSSLDRIGPWSRLWLEEDWEHDARLGALGGEVEIVEQELVEHRDHSGPLLSVGNPLDPWRLHQRSIAHQKVMEHAFAAGLQAMSPEMRRFARTLFFLARRCGTAGLSADAERLVNLSLQIGPGQRDVVLYRFLAGQLGWQRMGEVTRWWDVIGQAIREP